MLKLCISINVKVREILGQVISYFARLSWNTVQGIMGA